MTGADELVLALIVAGGLTLACVLELLLTWRSR